MLSQCCPSKTLRSYTELYNKLDFGVVAVAIDNLDTPYRDKRIPFLIRRYSTRRIVVRRNGIKALSMRPYACMESRSHAWSHGAIYSGVPWLAGRVGLRLFRHNSTPISVLDQQIVGMYTANSRSKLVIVIQPSLRGKRILLT